MHATGAQRASPWRALSRDKHAWSRLHLQARVEGDRAVAVWRCCLWIFWENARKPEICWETCWGAWGKSGDSLTVCLGLVLLWGRGRSRRRFSELLSGWPKHQGQEFLEEEWADNLTCSSLVVLRSCWSREVGRIICNVWRIEQPRFRGGSILIEIAEIASKLCRDRWNGRLSLEYWRPRPSEG